MKLKLSEIHPNPNNPRFIKDDKFHKLVQSLKDFPEMTEAREIVVNKDNIILGGNMRFKAMQEAGWSEATVKVVDWPEDKQRQFIIKDNVSGGEWDWDLLANEWNTDELDDWGLDLPGGFGQEEVEEDEAPEVSSEPPVSKLGEIYQLGRHKVMCGDSTLKLNVDDLMDGAKADMVFTDPPYGVKYVGGLNDKKREMIEGDDLELYSKFMPLLSDFCKSSAPIYIWFASTFGKPVFESVENNGYKVRAMIVWNKQNAHYGNFMAQYMQKHEPCLYIVKDSPKWYGATNETTVWDIEQPSKNEHHPTQKPVALPARAINNSSKTDDIILDLFLGSGSTLIACEQTDRICYGLELDPRYVDVIRKRYAKFIGEDERWVEVTPLIES